MPTKSFLECVQSDWLPAECKNAESWAASAVMTLPSYAGGQDGAMDGLTQKVPSGRLAMVRKMAGMHLYDMVLDME